MPRVTIWHEILPHLAHTAFSLPGSLPSTSDVTSQKGVAKRLPEDYFAAMPKNEAEAESAEFPHEPPRSEFYDPMKSRSRDPNEDFTSRLYKRRPQEDTF
ncbi:MAG: hypothetical protein WBA88_09500 [Pseudaminobacter sp.]